MTQFLLLYPIKVWNFRFQYVFSFVFVFIFFLHILMFVSYSDFLLVVVILKFYEQLCFIFFNLLCEIVILMFVSNYVYVVRFCLHPYLCISLCITNFHLSIFVGTVKWQGHLLLSVLNGRQTLGHKLSTVDNPST